MYVCTELVTRPKSGNRHLADTWNVWGSKGEGHPAIFHHRERGIMTLVHGDDYVSSAMSSDLNWLQAELENQYAIKTQRTREETEGDNEANILNRIVRRTSEGY